MGFWGIEVKLSRPFTYRSDDFQGRLHITQATLGTGSSKEKSILQCSVADKSPIFLCSLMPDKNETCSLNLEFEEDGEVLLSVLGPRSIHLSGFQVIGDHDCEDHCHSDPYGDISDTASEESTDYDSEEEYDDDFTDDDLNMYSSSPVPNSGVVIEEILDEKPQSKKAQPKRSKNKNRSNDDDSQKQIVPKSKSGVTMLESEDEDGFPLSLSEETKSIVDECQEKGVHVLDQKTSMESKKKRRRDDDTIDIVKERSLSKAVDVNISDGQSQRGPSQSEIPESDDKKKKQKKKQKQSHFENGNEAGSGAKNNGMPAVVEQAEKLTSENELSHISSGNQSMEKKKKNKKKNGGQESGAEADEQKPIATVVGMNGSPSELKKTEPKPHTFSNGFTIEELAMGKPNGKRASPGKKVSVRYIGKLQKNGSIFDSNVGGPPFKFRLGLGEVIKGWDVGVNGMRVGDKRKLTIPPSMGYGAKGAGKKIPPNAWLVFDVELLSVQ